MKKLTIHNPLNLTGNTVTATFRGHDLELAPKDEVKLVDAQGMEISYAEIVDVWQGVLADAPAILLEMSNDTLQRSFTGLHTFLMTTRVNAEQATPLDLAITILVLKPKTSTLIRPSAAMAKKFGV